MKKNKIIIYLIFLIHPFFSFSHVSHYDKIKLIEMDILRNGKKLDTTSTHLKIKIIYW